VRLRLISSWSFLSCVNQPSSNGPRLFCKACRQFLSTKHSSLEAHFNSHRHQNAKTQGAVAKGVELELATTLQNASSIPEPTLPTDIHVFRLKFLLAILQAGVSLNRSAALRELVEQTAFKLTSSSHLANYIPILTDHLKTSLTKRLKGQFVNLAFDGTTSFAETYAVTTKWLDDNLDLHCKLIRTGLFSSALKGPQLAWLIMQAVLSPMLSDSFGISSIHDSSSVNDAAMQHINIIHQLINLRCVSHLADNLGRKLLVPELDNFMRLYHQLFSHSLRAKVRFKERFNEAYVSFSAVRYVNFVFVKILKEPFIVSSFWIFVVGGPSGNKIVKYCDSGPDCALGLLRIKTWTPSPRLLSLLCFRRSRSPRGCTCSLPFQYTFANRGYSSPTSLKLIPSKRTWCMTRFRILRDVCKVTYHSLLQFCAACAQFFFSRGSFQNLRSAAQSRYLSWTLSFNVWQPEAHLS